VYIDAVFNPIFYSDERVFSQEGHRLRLENGTLSRQGVVLNEMRGVFSQPKSTASYAVEKLLFRDGSMRHVSGGDPSEIPKLTYEDFKKYHAEHYTTDNAWFVFMSKYPIENEVELIRKYAGNRRGVPQKVTLQKEKVMEREEVRVPTTDKNASKIYALGYLLYDQTDVTQEEYLALLAIDQLIHDSPASPFKKAGWGDFSSSLDTSQQQVYITTMSIGSSLGFDEYCASVQRVYEELAGDSPYVTKEGLVAALNQIQFRDSEILDDHGVRTTRRIFRSWLYGAPYDKFVSLNKTFDALRARSDLVEYAKQLIKKHFCGNHVEVNVIPDEAVYEATKEANDREMKELLEKMTDEEKLGI